MVTTTEAAWETRHACQEGLRHLNGMREVYNVLGIIPTSTAADTVLIRSHVAYWSGNAEADRVVIKPSRGHSYRVQHGQYYRIVRIADHYDHREGVTGWNG